jgi:hypothetical protein
MTGLQIMLCALLAAPVVTVAQTAAPAQPSSSMKTAPGPAAPGDPGAVVVPPKTDSAAIATPPKNVDPGIDAATEGVDAKNQQKSQEKKKGKLKKPPE